MTPHPSEGSPRARRRGWVFSVAAVFALAALTVATTGASGASTAAGDRFEAAGNAGVFKTGYVPMSLRTDAVTAIVQVAGDSVAAAEAEAGRDLTAQERQSIKRALRAKQAALRSQLRQLGGAVGADYQSAYNGIAVRIARTQLGKVAKLQDVVAVHIAKTYESENVKGGQLIGIQQAWANHYRGAGIKIGIIDTGIDYTHADFGGPGTEEAYAAADATDTAPADPLLFGPSALTKVKGGTDFVGDDYNASDPDHDTPMPDPNPLDCNGHGTHVAGTAAGFGVLDDGSTYGGPWTSNTYARNVFRIGPGMAPRADLYALRVFGCVGSTSEEILVAAIDWAFDNDLDVINMSLGSPFGRTFEPSAVASTDVAKAGMIVVASAGNSGPNQYITGSPAAATGAISVAANDPVQTTPGANIALSTGPTILAQNSNDEDLPGGALPIAVLRTSYPDGPVSLGCDPAEYGAYPGGVVGKLVVTLRGTCARVARAIYGQQAGAAAVAMINTDAGYPPFEGKITSNPDTGEPFEVTIPFLGVRGVLGPAPTADGDLLVAADTPQGAGGTGTLSDAVIVNTNFTGFASFTSGGPRSDDSWLKPDITAPGVSIVSAGVGTGNGPATISGTSMAAPHTAGVAALVKEAHPKWGGEDLKAAIVNTGDPAGVGGTASYRASRGGTGLVQPDAATMTLATAVGDNLTGSLSYGFHELAADAHVTKTITVKNRSGSDVTFDVSQTNAAGSPHAVSFSADPLVVPAGGSATLDVTLDIPVATVGDSNSPGLSFREVAGHVKLTPGSGENNDVALRVPYYAVPRALSSLTAKANPSTIRGADTTTDVTLTNGGPIGTNADFYTLGLTDPKEFGSFFANDVRSVGVQSFPFAGVIPGGPGDEQLIVFAINNWSKWSNASGFFEWDIPVDVNGDGDVDYFVVGVDFGAVTAGSFNGRIGAFVFSATTPTASVFFLGTARTDSSTLLLPILSRQLCFPSEPCLNSANPRFDYGMVSFEFGFFGAVDEVAGTGSYNPWNPSLTNGDFVPVAPGDTETVELTVDRAEFAETPNLGALVVGLDNKAGKDEAIQVKLKVR